MTAPVTTLPQMNATQERVLTLLGQGFPASVVASSVGCTDSYVSQLLAEEWFANLVQERKFLSTQKHVVLDDRYDSIEGKLLDKLEKAIPLIVRPGDITRTLQTINSAKRRSTPLSAGSVTQTIVNLTLPTAIIQKFVSNANNQIVEVQDGTGNQNTLVTTTSSSLERLAREASEARTAKLTYSGDIGNAKDISGEVSQSSQLSLSAEISAAQAGLRKGIPSTQKIAADDL